MEDRTLQGEAVTLADLEESPAYQESRVSSQPQRSKTPVMEFSEELSRLQESLRESDGKAKKAERCALSSCFVTYWYIYLKIKYEFEARFYYFSFFLFYFRFFEHYFATFSASISTKRHKAS